MSSLILLSRNKTFHQNWELKRTFWQQICPLPGEATRMSSLIRLYKTGQTNGPCGSGHQNGPRLKMHSENLEHPQTPVSSHESEVTLCLQSPMRLTACALART